MSGEEIEAARAFVHTLPQKRLQVSDGVLLDQCQEHLLGLLAHIDDAASKEEYPHEDAKYPEPAHIEEVPPDEPFVHKQPAQVTGFEPAPHKRPGRPRGTHPHKK